MMKCACPRIDARDCADFRSGRDLRRLLDAETRDDFMDYTDDGCVCACHEAQADYFDDDGDEP